MKLPDTPPASFTTESSHLRSYQGPLWRIYRTTGPHALSWDELRHHGPVPGMRFDPHPPSRGTHADVGVLYTATDATTALAEVFQGRRVIDRSEGRPMVVAWEPTRPLTLLDLTSNWPVLNGASASIQRGPKRSTQAWARAIRDRYADEVDGLWHLSAITGQPLVTVFDRADRVASFPKRTRVHLGLADVTADVLVAFAARRLGYGVLGSV